MEEKKNNLGIIILLVLLVLGLTGYIVFDKVLSGKENANEIKDSENANNSNEISSKIESGEIQTLDTKMGRFIISKEGKVYYQPSEEFNYGFGSVFKLEFSDPSKLGNKESNMIDGYKNPTGEQIPFESYELDLDNIVAGYEIYFGNGGVMDSVLFTKLDGTVDIFGIGLNNDNGQFITVLNKNISQYPNITSICSNMGSSASMALLIDKEGNKYPFAYNIYE